MPPEGPALTRLRKSLRRHTRDGWQQAVFAQPGETQPPQIIPGPGAGPPDEGAIHALVEAALAAAQAGRVKQTIVIDASRRVRIDARHGRARVITLDQSRAMKAMGGKNRALRPDQSAPLLRVIGIMNADGSISARHAKKYKQVNHFVELCRPVWTQLVAQRGDHCVSPLRIVDLGCGNGYLGFVLAEALRLAEVPARLHGVDRRAELVEQCRQRAQTLGREELSVQTAEIDAFDPAQSPLAGPPELVIALHACDTATDDALAVAVQAGTASILAAPCCQSELAQQLDRSSSAPTPALVQHSILRRSYAADLTDALRIELLQACGYHVDAIEFIGSEHTPKNLLLRAHRRHPHAPVEPERWRLAPLRKRCEALGVLPRLLVALERIVLDSPRT